MAQAIYIKSYAHAGRLGIKPFDSLISTVAIPARRPKIVAFRGKPMLDILLRELFTRKPRVVKVSYR